jgi:hypothetical protein
MVLPTDTKTYRIHNIRITCTKNTYFVVLLGQNGNKTLDSGRFFCFFFKRQLVRPCLAYEVNGKGKTTVIRNCLNFTEPNADSFNYLSILLPVYGKIIFPPSILNKSFPLLSFFRQFSSPPPLPPLTAQIFPFPANSLHEFFL